MSIKKYKKIEIDDNTLNAIISAISIKRFSRYKHACKGDNREALQLYVWNKAVAAAFYGPLHEVEILLRNTINASMTSKFGPF